MMYKDSNGRKIVAMGTDGTKEGKTILSNMMREEIKSRRSYGEISEPVVSFIKKSGIPNLEDFLIPADQVEQILKKPIEIVDKYTYSRLIGDSRHEKMMYGIPGKTITL